MAYTPTTWKTGDKVTAEKLNNIEQGIVDNELPDVTIEENGKVLGVHNGLWEAIDIEPGTELPEITVFDKNKYLHTNSETGDLEWQSVEIPQELPVVTSEDNGDVLTVVDGEWSKAAPKTDKTIPWLHTQPTSVGAYNAIRRMRQFTDMKWTPVESDKMRREYHIPFESYEETRAYGLRDCTKFFDKDVEYTGIPYGTKNLLGVRAPIEAFATSVTMKETAIIEESYNIRDYGSVYYGADCSGLVSYALCTPRLDTSQFVADGVPIPNLTLLHGVMNNESRVSMDDVQLADVLHTPGHIAMITDLIKDEDGHVTDIEVSEESMTFLGYARRWMWKLDEFYKWFNVFNVYRYTRLDAVDYYPCAFSPMPDEGNQFHYANYNVIPYKGNRTTITGENPTVQLIVKNLEDLNNSNPPGTLGYTHIAMEKNGTRLKPILIDSSQGTDAYNTGNIIIDPDEVEYNAYLVRYDTTQTPTMEELPMMYISYQNQYIGQSDGKVHWGTTSQYNFIDKLPIEGIDHITVDSDVYEYCVACFDATAAPTTKVNTGWISSSEYQQGGSFNSFEPGTVYVYVTYRRVDKTVMTDADVVAFDAAFKTYGNVYPIAKATRKCSWCYEPTHTPTITYQNGTLNVVVTMKNNFKPIYFYFGSDKRHYCHITPKEYSSAVNLDGSVTYTITYSGLITSSPSTLVVGYYSPEYGGMTESYSMS